MSLTTRVLIGLGAGFVLGLAIAGSSSPAVSTLLAVVAPAGAIFINLIRMTVIPLVASMLIASVGSLASSGALGRAGALPASSSATPATAAPIHGERGGGGALRAPAVTVSTGYAASAPAPAPAQWF